MKLKQTIYAAMDHHILVYLLICFSLVTAYLPAIHAYYLHTDDYFWPYGGFPCRSILEFLSIAGRPIMGVLFCSAKFVRDLGLMNLIRFLSLLIISGIAFIVFYWIRLHGIDPIISFCVSVIMFTMPTFQVYIAFLNMAPSGIAVLLSACSLIIVSLRVVERKFSRTVFDHATTAFCLLLAALAIYQPAGLFYCAMLSVPIVLADPHDFANKWARKIGVYFSILALAVLSYYLVWRVGLWLFDIPLGAKYDPRLFVTDIWERILWFIKGPLLETSNLWNIHPSVSISAVVGGLIGIILLADLSALQTASLEAFSSSVLNSLAKLSLIIALFPICYAISLVSSNPSSEYRTYPALTSLFVILCFLGPIRLLARVPTSLNQRYVVCVYVLFFVFGIYQASRTVSEYFVFPDSLEIRFIKSEIRRYQQTRGPFFSWIHIITARGPVATFEQRHEIGEPSARHGPNIRPMVTAALNELGSDRAIRVTHSNPDNPTRWFEWGTELDGGHLPVTEVAERAPDTIVIDMSQLRFQ